jgi:DNA polymerase
MLKEEQLNVLCKNYDKMQNKYGDINLNSVYFGGCINNPDICFVFINPTRKNPASLKNWKGIRAPWIGSKNIWNLFFELSLIDKKTYNKIRSIKGKEWDECFSNVVYNSLKKNKVFVTNLAKCTQTDARKLKDDVYIQYLDLFLKEMELINPKKIILFGNQVSSIVLNTKISVSQCRKKEFILNKKYKCFCVYYPVGNGWFNIDKSIEDLKYILEEI